MRVDAQTLYIFWFLHQTTTGNRAILNRPSCISFDSYIKPQQGFTWGIDCAVVYLLIPTSNHNVLSNDIVATRLYIFWFLHQTTTYLRVRYTIIRCISFDSYIKPQPMFHCRSERCVVYLLIPTSNHNLMSLGYGNFVLYIFWFLHQTTTRSLCRNLKRSCISFDSYIKPQLSVKIFSIISCCISFDSYIKPQLEVNGVQYVVSCISFDSYIKPQLLLTVWLLVSSCISFDSYIKPQLCMAHHLLRLVVYLLIPTSNHNAESAQMMPTELYIFWFLHQTTTCSQSN